jgi:hypothetical protein
MKKWIVSLVICFFLIALGRPILAEENIYQFRLPEKNEPIYGIWINEQYSGQNYLYAQKWEFLSWGYEKEYAKVEDTDVVYECTYILVEKRLDPEGNTWYKVLKQRPVARQYDLVRISKDLRVLERVTGAGFPDESDLVPTSTSYRTLTRK